ncbi:uncharacterized protein KY384_001619 [Bacidia gigantensis]|uniref:uncharacterized protein n=1 Tax=Bacidia gigantensis TaxID=2732470 RepID=UPI001D04146B|nr:uncharacterized protein KY384_001619 [Bacidia gigantensis]KAG8533878.1 hypothetical protein KY384_001619 [Bacidia gigantensis]
MEKTNVSPKTSPSTSTPSVRTTNDGRINKELDQAYWFIEKSKDAASQSATVDLTHVYRKVDWRIVPVMFLVLWGIATACTAAATDYSSLLAARIVLAIFEASLIPTQVTILSQWYSKSDQALRTAFWWCSVGAGQIIGGFLSWAFQQADNATFASWRIMFLVVGVVTIFIGIAAYWAMPDSPMTAKFLSTDEKVALLEHVSVNQTGVRNKYFKVTHLLEIFTDVQIWLFVVITILAALPTGVVTLYSATLLANAGFAPDISALLLIPQGIAGITAAIMCGYAVQYASHRWAWLVFLSMLGILGSALMSFLPTSNHAGLLAGIYITSAVTPALFLLFQWTASNVAGSTKRSIALPLIAGSFSAGSVIAPQTFQAKDAPDYLPAKITTMASQVAGALLTFLLFCYYVWMNRRRDRHAALESRAVEHKEQDLWEDLTDSKNPNFRYVY